MKKALFTSICLNLALGGCFVILVTHLKIEPTATPDSTTNQIADVIATNPPFNWSELESKDYRVYIRNLKQIGCPDQTIRDIIKADVGELYAARLRQLGIGATPPALQLRAQALRHEETWVLATLLEDAPATNETSESSEIPRRTGRANTREQPVSMPLVFQNVDLRSLKLNADQLQAIEDLRQRFFEDIGGSEQNPSDPAYRARWVKSQPQIDNELRGMIGVSTFQQYQLQAFAASDNPSGAK